MSNPCSNCHNAPYTGEALPDHLSLESEACPAREAWPEALSLPLTYSQLQDWWVRDQYFRTAQALDPQRNPFQIDLSKASLQVELKPKDFILGEGWKSLHVRPSATGVIRGQVRVQDNAIPLQMETLLSSMGIFFDGPSNFDISEMTLSVGDYGALHGIFRISPDLYDSLSDPGLIGLRSEALHRALNKLPFGYEIYSPSAFPGCFPLGRENPRPPNICMEEPRPLHDLSQCCEDVIRQMGDSLWTCFREDHPLPFCRPMEYPHPVDNPKLDLGLSAVIPLGLREADGRLPYRLDLNRLLNFLMTPQSPKKEKLDFWKIAQKIELSDSFDHPKSLLDLLHLGEFEIDVAELRDLYFPGLFDMGPSHIEIHGNYDDAKGMDLQISTMDLNFDPMGYPSRVSTDPPVVMLHGARVQNLDPQQPALKIHGDPKTGRIDLEARWRVSAELTLPFLGKVLIESPLEIRLSFNRWGELLAGNNQIILKDLHIQRDHAKVPLNTHLKISLNDQEKLNGDHYRSTTSEHPHFNLSVLGSLGDKKGHWIDYDAYLPMATHHRIFKVPPTSDCNFMGMEICEPKYTQAGAYDFAAISHDFSLNGALKWGRQENADYSLYLDLNTFKPHAFNSKDSDEDFGFRLNFGVMKGARTGEEQRFVEEHYQNLAQQAGVVSEETMDPDWLLDGGSFQFQRVKKVDGSFLNLFDSEIDHLNLGSLVLKDMALRGEIKQAFIEEGVTQLSIPTLRLTANPHGSPAGRIRGPITLRFDPTEEDEDFYLLWDHQERQLNFNHLNLYLAASGIEIPKNLRKLQKQHRRELARSGESLSRKVGSLGLDGRIQGHFNFNFEDWKGGGDLRVLGDRDGDIYLLTQKGERISPPLLRLTQWKFKRFDQLLFDQGFAFGAFRLFTRMNTAALRKFGYEIQYEPDVIMSHKDVPVKPGGIEAATFRYYRILFKKILEEGGLGLLLGEEEK